LNYIDYVIIVIVLVGFLLGFKDGLVRKLIGLTGLLVGVILAYKFSGVIGKFTTPFFNDDAYLANLISGILIFLAVILIASILKRVVHPLDKVNRLLNQSLGGIIGAVQIMFFISAFLLFLNIFGVPNNKQRSGSMFYGFVSDMIPKTVDLVAGPKAKVQDYIKEYIEKKDVDTLSQIDTLKKKNDRPRRSK
jgi:membrane protein required for colicin V production